MHSIDVDVYFFWDSNTLIKVYLSIFADGRLSLGVVFLDMFSERKDTLFTY